LALAQFLSAYPGKQLRLGELASGFADILFIKILDLLTKNSLNILAVGLFELAAVYA
jgi:hypothetical protein